MEFKEIRGHTSGKPSRSIKHVPEFFEHEHDASVAKAIDRRIALIMRPPLKRCLATLFAANKSDFQRASIKNKVTTRTSHSIRTQGAINRSNTNFYNTLLWWVRQQSGP
jgi:hypothetical protein